MTNGRIAERPSMWAQAALWAVLGLAASLRLFRLNYGEYQWDDDGLWTLAVNAVHQHVLPAASINSTTGARNGPALVYFLMPFAAISHAPLAGVIGLALLNAAGVYFLYRFVREFFGERPAIVAALLLAISPWALMFSRHIVLQGLLIPIQILLFWCAARWLAGGGARDLLLTFLWLAIACLGYIEGLLFVPIVGLILAIGWRRLRLWPLLGGVGLWLALTARYLIVLATGEWRWLQFTAAGGGQPQVDASSLWYALVQALHTGFETLAPQTQAPLQRVAGLERGIGFLEIALYAAGILWAAWQLAQLIRERKSQPAQVYAVLFVWLLVPIAVYVRHQDILSWRHLTLTIPLPAIFTALLIDRMWPWLGAPLLAGLAANTLGLAGVFFSVIPTCVTNNVYALPYQQTFDLAGSVEQLASEAHTQRVSVFGRPSLGPILGSILSRDGLHADWIDTTHASALALPPASDPPAVYVTVDDASDVSQALRAGAGAQQDMARAIPCEGLTFRAYTITPDTLHAAVTPLLPVTLGLHTDNGMAIESLGAERRLQPGQSLSVGTLLQAPAGAPPATLFVHLLDPTGKQVAGSDQPVARGESVEWQRLDLPETMAPGLYSLELGLYDNASQRLELADAAGKRIGATAVWGPLAVPTPPPRGADFTAASTAFGGQIELTGYRVSPGEIALRWQALVQPRADYTVFVHVLDPDGRIVAQDDSQPVAGKFPTGAWLPGETVVDVHPLTLPSGSYTIQVGLYELATQQRLPGGPFEVQVTI